jgi:hypothetical protein
MNMSHFWKAWFINVTPSFHLSTSFLYYCILGIPLYEQDNGVSRSIRFGLRKHVQHHDRDLILKWWIFGIKENVSGFQIPSGFYSQIAVPVKSGNWQNLV